MRQGIARQRFHRFPQDFQDQPLTLSLAEPLVAMAPLPHPNGAEVIARIKQADGGIHMAQFVRQSLQLPAIVLHFACQLASLGNQSTYDE